MMSPCGTVELCYSVFNFLIKLYGINLKIQIFTFN